MPAKPKKLKLEPPLTEEEKARLYPFGITEEKIIRDPMLRFFGIFKDDPEFMPMIRREYREGRGREYPECPMETENSTSSTQTSSQNVSAKTRKRSRSSCQSLSNNEGELLTGRFQQFQGADTIERLVSAQQRLDQTKEFLSTFPALLPMDKEAASIFFDLSRQRGLKKIGRRDLMIVAIAIAHRATLVTGNVQHFARVPRLPVRNWRGR